MSQPKTFNGDQKIKLVQIINEGMQVMQHNPHVFARNEFIHRQRPRRDTQ